MSLKSIVINSTNSLMSVIGKDKGSDTERITLITNYGYIVCSPVKVKVKSLKRTDDVSEEINSLLTKKGEIEPTDLLPSMVEDLLKVSGTNVRQNDEVIYAKNVHIYQDPNSNNFIKVPSIAIFVDHVFCGYTWRTKKGSRVKGESSTFT
ncbi:hypothetical protein [Salirhabdus salicampi]|uniref:hypothetical protein n=1 Tax=Salirhabdus salicampi TaxID=476102 RepID=UPI0020C42FC8|nr:hypothetical protein [Salirhabdus salicampi]MCP8617668.1 hypothetical protein [Salirhabdus salicampi]